jgi:hypothetical protein
MALLATTPALGLIQGGVTLGVPGPLAAGGTAMAFNGINGFISCPPLPLPGTAISLEAWAYPTSFNTDGSGIVDLYEGHFYFNLYNGTPEVYLSGLPNPGYYQATQAVTLNAWFHLVATWDGYSVVLYIDGTAVTTFTDVTGTMQTGGPFNIAHGGSGDPRWWQGSLGQMAIYSYALSPVQVQAHTAAAQSATPGVYAATVLADSPLAYWPLTEPTGVVAGDRANLAAVTVLDAA